MQSPGSLGAWQTFWQMSDAAFVLLVLLFVIIQAVLVIAPLKALQLRRLTREERVFEAELDARCWADLRALVAGPQRSPGGRVLQHMVQARDQRDAGYEELLGCARRAVAVEQSNALRLMPTLASIASTAPLLGLFGTVWGIIEAFLTIAAEKSSELPVIAPAMSGALLTTALGLIAAMPASVAHNAISSRVDAMLDQIDGMAQSWAGRLTRQA